VRGPESVPIAAALAVALLTVQTPALIAQDTPGVVFDETSGVAERLDDYLTRLEALGFSGGIIVEHEGKVVLRKGYGLRERTARLPQTPATVQDMLSVTKTVTAAAVLLLDERAELSVDDPISGFIDGVPDDKSGITIHHLLTHQGGLPGAIGRDDEWVGAQEYVQRAMAVPLVFEPGTDHGYSNVGYSLLGIIIERVTGVGYEEFVRNDLLLPAGLAHTGYVLARWSEPDLAFGYRNGELFGRTVDQGWTTDGPGWHLRANGGMHTTLTDMHRWLDVLRGSGPLSPDLVERWTAPHIGEGEFHRGYAWGIRDTPFGRMVAHNGGNPAFSSDFVWIPDQDLFFYVHGNTSLIPASRLRESLVEVAFDFDPEVPPLVSVDPDTAPDVSAARVGVYVLDGGTITLRADDTRLLSEVTGQAGWDELLGHSESERQLFARLTQKASSAIERLADGRDDAFADLVESATDAAERAQRTIEMLERPGEFLNLTLVGSVRNVPGTQFGELGGLTTFVQVDYPADQRILSLLWTEDGNYRGAALGPTTDVPQFTWVPTGGATYTAVERGAPWRVHEFRFDGDCLVVPRGRACRE
jgi:CubicO group peptidase (beta-lactamase class C family)